MNSYSGVLHYNHIDYQAMLEEKKNLNRKPHEPTLIRQVLYCGIFFFIFLGLVELVDIKIPLTPFFQFDSRLFPEYWGKN